MSALKKTLRAALLVGGWLALIVIAAIYLAERSGSLTDLFNSRLAAYLAPLDERFVIGRVRIDWAKLSLRLEDLRLGEDGQDLVLRKLEIVPGLLSGRIDNVSLRDGQIRLARDQRARVRRWLDMLGPVSAPGERQAGPTRSPVRSFDVRRLEIELAPGPGESWPIGTVDAHFTAGASSASRLSGRLTPASWWAGDKQGVLVLTGTEVEPGILEVRTLVRDVELGLGELPPGLPLEALRPLAPKGRANVEAWGRFALAGNAPPLARVRATVNGGELLVPGAREPLRALALALEAEFAPRGDEFLFDLPAWSGHGRLNGSWREQAFSAGILAGSRARSESQVEAWCRVPRLEVERAEEEEWLGIAQNMPAVRYPLLQLAARGAAEVFAAFRLPRGWRAREGIGPALENLVHVRADGGASLAYAGPADESGARERGFPLRVDGIRGEVLSSWQPDRARRGIVGLVELEGRVGSAAGRALGTGIISSPAPDAERRDHPEVDLRIVGFDIEVDERLREAASGLRRWLPEEELWQRYGPSAGEVDLDLRIVTLDRLPWTALRILLDLEDAALQWSPLPVPLNDVRGRVELLADGAGRFGFRARCRGDLRTAESIDLRLRSEYEPEDGALEGAPARGTTTARVDVQGLSLRGDDVEVVARTNEAVGGALAAFRPKGFVDVRAVLLAGEPRLVIELAPRENVEVQPEAFPMTTAALRGRLLVDALPTDDGASWRAVVHAQPLVGSWGSGVPVALVGSFDGDADGERALAPLRLYGAGIDAANRRLLGSLSTALAADRSSEGSALNVDPQAIAVSGRIDFAAEIGAGVLGGGRGAAASRGALDVFLRENSIASGRGFEFDSLEGRLRLDLDAGSLSGERLSGVLGTTPVTLTDPSIRRQDGALRFAALLDATSVPLDREHLSMFIGEETVAVLLDELEGRGRIDVHGAELSFTNFADGSQRLEFSGPLTLSDLFVRMGVPLSVRSAQGFVEELVVEDGRVRGWGRLADTYGQLAERRLDRAEMLVTYVQPRLAIEDLSGAFVDDRGEVFALGGGRSAESATPLDRSAPAFSIDLAPPFPFQLAVGLRGVDVQGFTKGLFASNAANEGRLDGELTLAGDLADLLAIRGSGYGRIFDGRLWSVPVVRTVFTQLGLDDTAVFDQMSTRFTVEDGVIHMSELRARSPILRLVGTGTLDFDGSLAHDLEVNYSLIDKLGPLTRLVYMIQNSLIRVTIRGDMARPKVVLRGILSGILGAPDSSRELPLPEPGELPARF